MLIIGYSEIAKYCQRSVRTIHCWVATQSFPIGTMPSGEVAVTESAVMEWLQVRRKVLKEHPNIVIRKVRGNQRQWAKSGTGATNGS